MGLCCRGRGAYARPVTAARWATFDCYGTLVDWNAGIGAELGRLLGPAQSEQLLARYHAIEPRVQNEHPTMAGTITRNSTRVSMGPRRWKKK